tara:strand:- start:472 stop:1044 length:573 start_codon:yes stop_codon:yes gene_type:complete
MRKYLLPILLIGLAWGQSEYPYFKDMTKQLKFEQKRIYIAYDGGYKITRNGKIVSELDFLYTLGLKKQADSLYNVYKKEMSDFLSPNQVNRKLNKRAYEARLGMCFGVGTIFGLITIRLLSDEYYRQIALVPAAFSLGSIYAGVKTNKEKYIVKVKKKKKLPMLEKFFTKVQIQSMAEAYNRKLFDDISR